MPRVLGWLRPTRDAPDGGWRRGVAALGLVALAVVVGGVVPELSGRAAVPAAALLALGGVLWLVELVATPRRAAVELVLLIGVGWCGAALNALVPESAGFILAYLAASGLGLRLGARAGAAATVAVLVGLDAGIVATSTHVATSLTTTDLGIAFVFVAAAATRGARVARARTAALLAELERSRAAQEQAAALAERSRLAREIHDILAHALSGLVMSLEGARLLAQRTGADPRVVEEVVRAHGLARSGLSDTRRAIGALRGDVLPGPDLLPQLVEQAGLTHGIRATFQLTGEPRPLHADAALTVYRTAQEALTNTAKHAGRGASTALALTWLEDRVELVASDRRRGDARVELPSSGYGLSGLRERAELAGGTLLTADDGSGFRLHLCLPYTRDDGTT